MHPPQASSFVTARLPGKGAGKAAHQATTKHYEEINFSDDESYKEIARLAADLCGTSAAMLSFVNHDRQWLTARVGIDTVDCRRALFFCAHAMRSVDQVMIVPDVAEDERFGRNWGHAGGGQFRFYAGAPVVAPLGAPFGMICVLDRDRRGLTEAQAAALSGLGRQVARQLALAQENAALRVANAKLSEISNTDALTCIANRRAFDERLAAEERRAREKGEPFSLLLMDVDRFKDFNDRHGHRAGDQALYRIANGLKSDNRSTDLLARYGGEEFALILPNTRLEAAIGVAERLRATVEALDGPYQQLTLSIGAAAYDPKHQADELVAAADRALYAAKAIGRNRVVAAAAQQAGFLVAPA